MTDAWLCDYVRTPIGRYGGALASVRADDLAAHPVAALVARHPGLADAVDEIVLGCANQAGEDNRNVARMVALLTGLGDRVPGLTVNRLCASGLDAVVHAARAIRLGEARVMLAGGVESMSRAPFVMPKTERAFSRTAEIHDTTIGWRFVNPVIAREYGVHSMPETADNLAAERGVSRADADAYALRSQRRTAAAADILGDEIAPVEIAQRRETRIVDRDEHPRPDSDAESLARLAPLNEGGVVTAGNASGVNDGAAALALAAREAALEIGLRPRARLVAAASAGVPPRIMGIGPAEATRRALAQAGLKLEDIGVIEINEAFAAQVLACTRELGLEDEDPRVNATGGAIALGHPLGMSGARLAGVALRELERRDETHALVTLCVGVGQGVAAILSRE